VGARVRIHPGREPIIGTQTPLIVRPPRGEDFEPLGRITAARDGGDPAGHAAALARFPDGAGEGKSLLLVAEIDGSAVAFGKCRYSERPADPAPDAGPEGWYLAGLIVDEAHRRRGVGRRLTAVRMDWIAARADVAYYFANARNAASIALHREFGFEELARRFTLPGAVFEGGEGILFRARLAPRGRGGP
jgi:ribosomal protein S18 acetylase RimI-like enzyme